MFKRAFDIFAAIFLIIVLLPFIPIFILIVLTFSRKSLFIKSTRVGKTGKLFKMIRFNLLSHSGYSTTVRDPLESEISSFALKAVKILNLNGWPMLFNVLKGDLSFIGPFPEIPEIVDQYTEEQREILSVRPGILGIHYFHLRRNNRAYETKINIKTLDSEEAYILFNRINNELAYVRDKNPWKDMKVVLKSIIIRIRNAFLQDVKSGIRTYNFLVPLDMLLISLSYLFAFFLRFEFGMSSDNFQLFFTTLPIVLAIKLFVYNQYDFYKNIWKYFGIQDLFKIVKATTISVILIVTLLFFVKINGHSRSVFLIDWIFCISLIGASRLALRLTNENINLESTLRKNVLIIGAGDVGEMLLRELNKTARNEYLVLGFIDDNTEKHGLTIHDVRVLGDRKSIPEFVQALRIDEVFIAIANISASEIKGIIHFCKKAGVRHRIVPAVNDLINGNIHISRMRNVEISDLFGRKPINLDISAITNILFNRRVLVTGAGGSIGSELCRQIAEYNPKSLILVDKNENYLHNIRIELANRFPKLHLICSLSDVTDYYKQHLIFNNYKPQIVFHAAAQKHVPLSEENPDEAIHTNIHGTRIIANLSFKSNVSHFTMVSTDKAVNPTSIMGATKKIAEMYIQALSKKKKTKFITVRFGNVLNSNGSVVPTFLKQIEKGGPITVTHPNIERYFMSIDEAVQLILQAVSMGENGQIFILEMGKSIKIIDLAKELTLLAGAKPYEDIDIVFTGLRPGEKLFEELIGRNEKSIPTFHSNIKTLQADTAVSLEKLEYSIQNLITNAKLLNYSKLIQNLKHLIPEYTPSQIAVSRLENSLKLKRYESKFAKSQGIFLKQKIAGISP